MKVNEDGVPNGSWCFKLSTNGWKYLGEYKNGLPIWSTGNPFTTIMEMYHIQVGNGKSKFMVREPI